jgi:hypothetical protein
MNLECQQLELAHNLNDIEILKPCHASKFLNKNFLVTWSRYWQVGCMYLCTSNIYFTY